jgi:hypothetical protein
MSDSLRREFGYSLPTPRFHQDRPAAVHPRFVGSPMDACYGFVVAASHLSSAYAEFSRLVVPELQRPSRFHTVYVGTTRARTSVPIDRGVEQRALGLSRLQR